MLKSLKNLPQSLAILERIDSMPAISRLDVLKSETGDRYAQTRKVGKCTISTWLEIYIEHSVVAMLVSFESDLQRTAIVVKSGSDGAWSLYWDRWGDEAYSDANSPPREERCMEAAKIAKLLGINGGNIQPLNEESAFRVIEQLAGIAAHTAPRP